MRHSLGKWGFLQKAVQAILFVCQVEAFLKAIIRRCVTSLPYLVVISLTCSKISFLSKIRIQFSLNKIGFARLLIL